MKSSEKNLAEQIIKVEGNISFYKMRVPLPCQRFLSAGRTCGQETDYAIVVERMDYNLVIPICEKHAPKWAKEALKEKRKGEKKNGGSNTPKTKRTSRA